MGGQQTKVEDNIINQQAIAIPAPSAISVNFEIVIAVVILIIIVFFLKYIKKYIQTHINRNTIRHELNAV